jgi:hypothetical protein
MMNASLDVLLSPLLHCGILIVLKYFLELCSKGFRPQLKSISKGNLY